MATAPTRNVVAGGGRASGGSVVSPTETARQIADNSGVTAGGSTSGEGGFALPELSAEEVDRLFADDDADAQLGEGSASPETGQGGVARGRRDTIGAGGGEQGFNAEGGRYSRLGWDLGWNAVGSNITRGAAAFGLRENPSHTSETESGTRTSGPRYTNLTEIADFAGVDTAGFRNPDGTLNEDGLKAAVDDALKDYYFVSGDTGGIPGVTGAQPGRFASSLYRRDGNSLRAVSGTGRVFNAPQNSAGHFAEYVAPVAGILAAPILGGLGITGAGGSLTSAISSTTGLSPFWSNIIGSGLTRGGMSALGGGNFGRAALGGAITAGVSPMIAEGAAELAGPGTTGASLLTGAGNLGVQAILSGGQITPMGAVTSLLSGFGRGRNGGRNR